MRIVSSAVLFVLSLNTGTACYDFSRRTWLYVVLGPAVVLLTPVPMRVAPAWEIAVVDQKGHAVAGCRIREKTDYKALAAEQALVEVTDAAGVARFPARSAGVNLAMRALVALNDGLSMHGGHTAFPTVFFVAKDPGLKGEWILMLIAGEVPQDPQRTKAVLDGSEHPPDF